MCHSSLLWSNSSEYIILYCILQVSDAFHQKLSERTQYSLRIKELKEREIELETRLNEKIKNQIELDRKLGLLAKQEEQLILESENFDGMAQSTPKVKFDSNSQKERPMRQQSGKQEPFFVSRIK